MEWKNNAEETETDTETETVRRAAACMSLSTNAAMDYGERNRGIQQIVFKRNIWLKNTLNNLKFINLTPSHLFN